MMPRGRCAHVVKPKGTLVQTSQYWVDGSTLILTRMPASFHCSTMVCTASSSQAGCGRQAISTSMPLAYPASASSFLALATSRWGIGNLAQPLVGDLEDGVRVDGVAHGLAHALVVERLHRLHARGGRVGRGHLV